MTIKTAGGLMMGVAVITSHFGSFYTPAETVILLAVGLALCIAGDIRAKR